MMTFSMTISMRNQRRNFLDKFSKKKESDDNDDFDDVEEKAVKTAPKQASAPKQTASAPSKVRSNRNAPNARHVLQHLPRLLQ